MNVSKILRSSLLLLGLVTAAHAQVPALLNHQGLISTRGTNFTGTGRFMFALMDGTGAPTFWSNGVATVALPVNNGLYSVVLGDTGMNPIPPTVFTNTDVRLRVWFNDGVTGLQQLSPDQRLASVGTALLAQGVADGAITSSKLAAGAIQLAHLGQNGATTGQVLMWTNSTWTPVAAPSGPAGATGPAGTTSWTDGTGNVTTTVNVGIGTNNPACPLDVVTQTGNYGGIRLTDANGSWLRLYTSLQGGSANPITQPGDHGFIFEGASGIGSGSLVIAPHAATTSGIRIETNGYIGIAKPNPATALDVNGTVTATSFSGSGAGLTGVNAATTAIPSGMALIPAGSFTMGNSMGDSDITDAKPVTVNVSAFYMDINLVSYSQWLSVYYWAEANGYDFRNAGAGKAANHPVQTVDWYDTVKWCNARSEQAGKNPVYYTDAGFTTVYRTGEVAVYANWTANGFRLPTEAEWEKAARGGLSGQRFPWGNTISENLANYTGFTYIVGDLSYFYDLGPDGFNAAFSTGASPYTSPVGYFAQNGYGLYDMAGNVFQWCWDWYGTPYAGGTNPRGAASADYRVLRGGTWVHNAKNARCANRDYNTPSLSAEFFGFRCVRGL